MQKKRILIFNDCFYMGGTEILLVNLLNHLIEKENCEISLLLPNPSDKNILLERVSPKVSIKYIFKNELHGIKRWLYKNCLIFHPKLFARLVHFQEQNYDKVICFKDGFYSILFSQLNIPRILWIQNQPFIRDYKGKTLKEWFAFKLNRFQINKMISSFDKFNKVICVSDTCQRDYIQIYQKKYTSQTEVLYNALDLSGIEERSKSIIEGIDSNRFTFVVVIRLSHEKTVERVIYATQRLLEKGYQFQVQILGDGAEYNKLKELINQYDLNGVITMYGRVNNPFPYMKHADWFLCPSSRESFALTLLESISLGTPVITTRCGGPEDVVGLGKYGILVENSIDGVFHGMKMVLDNPNLKPHFQAMATENLSRFNYTDWLKSVDTILNI